LGTISAFALKTQGNQARKPVSRWPRKPVSRWFIKFQRLKCKTDRQEM